MIFAAFRIRIALALAPRLRELLEEGAEWAERPVKDQEDAAMASWYIGNVRTILSK